MSQGDSNGGSSVQGAARRLEMAVAFLESRVGTLSGRAESSAGGLFDDDRSKLAAELDASRARERELKEAGAEASRALARAIEEIRRALDGTEEA